MSRTAHHVHRTDTNRNRVLKDALHADLRDEDDIEIEDGLNEYLLSRETVSTVPVIARRFGTDHNGRPIPHPPIFSTELGGSHEYHNNPTLGS